MEALEALQGEDFEDFELFTEPELRLSFQDTVPAELETMPAPPRPEDLELLTASQEAWWLKSAAKTEEDEDEEEEEDFEDEE